MLGIPPLAAVGLALVTTALGVFVDLLRIGTVGRVFEIGYLLGCVLAVGWVRRRSIFLPAVQPPLLLAVVVPVMAVLIGAPTGGGAAQSALMAGAPLINAFPAMALTTVVVALVTAFRLLRQRLGPDDAVGLLRTRLGREPGGHDPDGPRGAGPGSRPADRPRPDSGSADTPRPGSGSRSARRSRAGAGDRGDRRTGDRAGARDGRAGDRGDARGERGGGGDPGAPRASESRAPDSRAPDSRAPESGASRAGGGARRSSATRSGESARTRRRDR